MHRICIPILLIVGYVACGHVSVSPTALPTYNKDIMSGILESFMSPNGVNLTRLLESFNPSSCVDKCMPYLGQMLTTFSNKSIFDTKATVELCSQLEEVDSCASTCDSALLDIATKTYKFACVDKIESIGDSLKCAQEAFSRSRSECESGCITTSHNVDPSKIPIDVSSLCTSSVCLLGCMQKSINDACLKSENSSLFDAILTTSTQSGDAAISTLLQGMLPNQCRDVIKQQSIVSDGLSQIGHSIQSQQPLSVGKPNSLRESDSTSTTEAPLNGLLWDPSPVEAPLEVDGEMNTLQCRMLDWERKPIVTPHIDKLARLIAAQLVNSNGMEMRSDDGDNEQIDYAFRRWADSHDRESYKSIGFGVRTRDDGIPLPELRANSDLSQSLPSSFHIILAIAFPFVIFLIR